MLAVRLCGLVWTKQSIQPVTNQHFTTPSHARAPAPSPDAILKRLRRRDASPFQGPAAPGPYDWGLLPLRQAHCGTDGVIDETRPRVRETGQCRCRISTLLCCLHGVSGQCSSNADSLAYRPPACQQCRSISKTKLAYSCQLQLPMPLSSC